jgi:hypothetical protein
MAIGHEIRDAAKFDGKSVRRVSLTPVRAIRYFCVECMGGSFQEVSGCTDLHCALFPYRLGKRPDAGSGGS